MCAPHSARSRPAPRKEPTAEERVQARELKAAQAKALLPDEPLPFVIGAMEVVRYRGDDVTAENVLARLKSEGRTRAQIMARAAAAEREDEVGA